MKIKLLRFAWHSFLFIGAGALTLQVTATPSSREAAGLIAAPLAPQCLCANSPHSITLLPGCASCVLTTLQETHSAATCEVSGTNCTDLGNSCTSSYRYTTGGAGCSPTCTTASSTIGCTTTCGGNCSSNGKGAGMTMNCGECTYIG